MSRPPRTAPRGPRPQAEEAQRRDAERGRGRRRSDVRPASAPRRRRIVVPLTLTVLTLVAVFFFLVSPARTWLDQRSQLVELEGRLDEVGATNEELEARIAALQTDAEIARIAREQYNLVRPGDEAYVILPPPTTVPPDDAAD